ncbi:MAG TPA: hypothetical protein VFY92_09195 [Hyphomicrobiaceae bacterium]|nr:hypothetical protein [Hyphomicrobiaceae bacterium]
MTRWIAASAGILAVTLSLGLAVPFVNNAHADGISAPVYRPVFRHKRCIAPASWLSRSQTTWVCNAEEKCCYDRVLRKGSCLPAGQRCF